MAEPIEALETIELLYSAAVEPGLWPAALHNLAHAVGGVGTALIPITLNSTAGLVLSPRLLESKEDYERGWFRYDSRVARIHARKLSRGVCCEAELFTSEEVARDPLRQEFCRSYGMGDFAAHLIEPQPGLVVAFSVMRALTHDRFEKHELQTLGLLGKHAARALIVSTRLAAANRSERTLLGALSRFDCGALVIDEQLKVLYVNDAAERSLGKGLVVDRGRLHASSRRHQPALVRLLRSALTSSCDAGELEPITLPRPSGGRPLFVQAIPVRGEDFGGPVMAGAAAVVIVIDPDGQDRSRSPIAALRLLGLTPAQARLAALIGAGQSRAEAAASLGISEWTARDTLKEVYFKLDISRQSDLVKLVDRLAVLDAQTPADRG